MSRVNNDPTEARMISSVSSTPPIAVVLSADSNGLGAIRSLTSAGVPAWALVTSRQEIVTSSRLPRKVLFSADSSDAAILSALEAVPDGSVLIPTSDRYVLFLERHRARLAERWCASLPPIGLGDVLIDKAVETARVRELGLDLPTTVHPLPSTPELLLEALKLPIIVKPRSFEHADAVRRKNVILECHQDVVDLYRVLGPRWDAVVAQEVVPGDDSELWVCNCTFGPDHRLVGAFSFQRLGTSPAHYGVTSLALSRRNPEVVGHVARLGFGLGYVGPAMIEFKRDPRDGRFLYIETNPRLGMCNWFDTTCGVNNVALSYDVARGVTPAAAPTQQEGVRYIDRLDDSWARRREGASWPDVLAVWRASRTPRSVGPYFAVSDPWPAFVMVGRRVSAMFRAAGRRLGKMFLIEADR